MVRYLLNIMFLLFFASLVGQNQGQVPDSLINSSYDDLFIKMNSSNDSELRKLYANIFLSKAKNERDTTNIITGYEINVALANDDTSMTIIDSIIKLTENNPDEFNPANAYLQRGNKYYERLAYKKSLESYLKAYQLSSQNYNQKLVYKSLQGVALIKNRIGDYKSAIEIHHKNLAFFERDTVFYEKDHYLNTLFSLSVLSLRLNNIDSSNYYNRIGFHKSKKYDWEEKMNQFRLAEGIVKYHKKDFINSIDSITKSIDILREENDNTNLIHAYFYLAQNSFELNKNEIALNNLLKVDSLYLLTGIIEPDTRHTYRQLYDFFESTGDSERQLFFLKKLITIDSTYYINQKLIGSKIATDYDLPNLLSSKERLINVLRRGEKSMYYLIIILILLIGIVFLFFRRKQKIQFKKFEAIVSGSNFPKVTEKPNKNLDVPSEIVEEVSKKLQKFEENNEYINSSLTLASLAKDINTNSNYLSKIVNHIKGKNFASYLNELRIEYAILKLKNDTSFRKYTINAIASEVGFKSAETFSKSFKSVTKIYPSYFIKKLENQ